MTVDDDPGQRRDHSDKHRVYEHIVYTELKRAFEDAPMCRIGVLLELLADEVEELTDVEDVQETIAFMYQIVVRRLKADHQLFDTAGSA